MDVYAESRIRKIFPFQDNHLIHKRPVLFSTLRLNKFDDEFAP